MVLNTIFLVREIRRNERHDSFLNAVTHELKTPIASIRLYLETLQRRDLNEESGRNSIDIMIDDSERLLATVEQVLKAGEVGHARPGRHQHSRRHQKHGGGMRRHGDAAQSSATGNHCPFR